MKVFAFAASARKDSLNKKFIAQAVRLLQGNSDLVIDHADFREFDMPLYDGDLEAESGVPMAAQKLHARLVGAQAVIISTPEYNAGMPGPFKNAVDWVSRIKPSAFAQKPILLLGASPGGLGAVRSLWQSRVPLEGLGAFVYPEMFGLSLAHLAFDEKNNLKDPKALERLQTLNNMFLKWAKKLT